MKTGHFIAKLDRKLIETAIQQAELKTSGEIRVVIHHKPADDAVAAAQAEFLRRGMQKTRQRNAVLILVAPVTQKFAVIGDTGVHEKCGDSFWLELAAAMTGHFKQAQFTAGLMAGIERAGSLLAAHFPREPDDRDELSNQVVEQ